MKKRWPFKLLMTASALIATGTGIYFYGKKIVPTGKTQKLGEVKSGDLVQRVSITGMVTPLKSTLIVAPYNGYIRKIYVRVGDLVKEGAPLVAISQTAHHVGEELYPTRAPFAGTVVQVSKSEGEFIEEAVNTNHQNAILRIDDLTKFFVDGNVPEIDYPNLKTGQKVVIKISALGGKEYKGVIETIAKASKSQDNWDRSRVEYPLRIVLDSPDSSLAPGMSAIIDVITSEVKNISLLNHEYFQRDGTTGKFYVIKENGERANVEVGAQNSESVEIKQGLAVGEKIKPASSDSL
jgi:multidrug efflux pump subunit AcrA (membrane-fusion protein)